MEATSSLMIELTPEDRKALRDEISHLVSDNLLYDFEQKYPYLARIEREL